jgi:hypothetical protein
MAIIFMLAVKQRLQEDIKEGNKARSLTLKITRKKKKETSLNTLLLIFC